MTDPTFEPFLLEAIARTGVHRYRYLSLEQPDLAERAKWQSFLIDLASGTYTGDRHDPHAAAIPAVPCCGGQIPEPEG